MKIINLIYLFICFFGITAIIFSLYSLITYRRKSKYLDDLKDEFEKKIKEEDLPEIWHDKYEKVELSEDLKKFLEEKKYEIEDLQESLKKSKYWADPDIYYKIGFYYYTFENYNAAIKNFKKALNLNLKQKNAYFYMGVSYMMVGELDEAIKQLNESIVQNEKKAESFYNIGWIWDEKGNYEKAIEFYERSLEIKSGVDDTLYYDTIYNKACALAKCNRVEDSLIELKKVISKEEFKELAKTDEDLAILRKKGKIDSLLKD